MKLTAITLNDVRRFTSPVRVTGIGAGLNVMSAPNEEGKSTLFDALQALFFQSYRSRGKEITALRPHAGGAPTVIVDLTTAEGAFRIMKRWFSKPAAEVWQGSRLVAKADDAEAWIAALTQGKGDGGPAGLLWVRQGLTALDQGSKTERELAHGARRDLMSSVTGEVESLTGGRRMDTAIARCRDELDRYVTSGGRPKAGGPLKAAEDEVVTLSQRQRELTTLTETLRGNLDRRHAVRRELGELRAPEAIAERRKRLDTASRDHDAAQQHAERTARALDVVTMARMTLTGTTTRLATLRAARDELAHAERAASDADAFDAEARALLAKAESALAQAQAEAGTARAALAAAEATLRQSMKAEAARTAQTRRAEIGDRLTRAGAIEATLAADRKAAATGPDGASLTRLEKAAQEVAVLQKLRDSAAPDVMMHYAEGVTSGVSLDGVPLMADAHKPIPEGATLTLAGLGRLTIRPGKTADDTRKLAKAEADLAAALAAFDLPDMAAARHAATLRAEAASRLAQAQATLAGLAPNGVAALKAERDALPDPTGAGADVPAPDAAQRAVDGCVMARDAAEAALETASERVRRRWRLAQALVEWLALPPIRRSDPVKRTIHDNDRIRLPPAVHQASCLPTMLLAGERMDGRRENG